MKKRSSSVPPIAEAKVIPLFKKKVGYKCGHDGWENFKVDLYGETEITPKQKVLKRREHCPDCMLAGLLKGTIRCARCGFVIEPGDGVTLYPKKKERPAFATIIGRDMVGCMRWKCCPSGGLFVGNWDGEKMDIAA